MNCLPNYCRVHHYQNMVGYLWLSSVALGETSNIVITIGYFEDMSRSCWYISSYIRRHACIICIPGCNTKPSSATQIKVSNVTVFQDQATMSTCKSQVIMNQVPDRKYGELPLIVCAVWLLYIVWTISLWRSCKNCPEYIWLKLICWHFWFVLIRTLCNQCKCMQSPKPIFSLTVYCRVSLWRSVIKVGNLGGLDQGSTSWKRPNKEVRMESKRDI